MNTTGIPTLKHMHDFVSGAADLDLRITDKPAAYRYLALVAAKRDYGRLRKRDKGIVRAYLATVTGYSPATLSRLLCNYTTMGKVVIGKRTQPVFKRHYTDEDIAELARLDEIHHQLSGPAMVQLLRREYQLFGNAAYARLQNISVSHLYNLRGATTYKQLHTHYTKTSFAKVPIGKRAKPRPDGRPGFLRVDTVHQGDKDGEKGVYHINLVDEVTQWEVVVCVEGISERYIVPALEAAIALFPFTILNFHSDNGSEYINVVVAKLLELMLVKLTKSRPRHSGDNGLVETKNGSIIRKALGYVHIPRSPDNVIAINQWYQVWFVPYLNFHRPCGFRVATVDQRGKQTYRYPKEGYMTPYDKLRSLPNATKYLKPETNFTLLDYQAYALSDTDWAIAMQNNKAALWESLHF